MLKGRVEAVRIILKGNTLDMENSTKEQEMLCSFNFSTSAQIASLIQVLTMINRINIVTSICD